MLRFLGAIKTHKTINFPFGTHGKSMVLGVSILKHCGLLKQFGVMTELFVVSGKWREERQREQCVTLFRTTLRLLRLRTSSVLSTLF